MLRKEKLKKKNPNLPGLWLPGSFWVALRNHVWDVCFCSHAKKLMSIPREAWGPECDRPRWLALKNFWNEHPGFQELQRPWPGTRGRQTLTLRFLLHESHQGTGRGNRSYGHASSPSIQSCFLQAQHRSPCGSLLVRPEAHRPLLRFSMPPLWEALAGPHCSLGLHN